MGFRQVERRARQSEEKIFPSKTDENKSSIFESLSSGYKIWSRLRSWVVITCITVKVTSEDGESLGKREIHVKLSKHR